MNSLKKLLNKFSNEIIKSADKNNFDADKINSLFEPYLSSNMFLIIVKLESFIPVFISENVSRYLNLSKEKLKDISIKDVQEHVNLESSNVFYSSLNHFCNQPEKELEMCYQIKKGGKDLKWIYGVSKALTFKENGQPDYVLTLSLDIATLITEKDLLNESIKTFETVFINTNNLNVTQFTDREIELLNLISQGYSNNKISKILFISEHTVKTHRKNIMKKIGAKNGSELMRYAMLFSLKGHTKQE